MTLNLRIVGGVETNKKTTDRLGVKTLNYGGKENERFRKLLKLPLLKNKFDLQLLLKIVTMEKMVRIRTTNQTPHLKMVKVKILVTKNYSDEDVDKLISKKSLLNGKRNVKKKKQNSKRLKN